MNGATHNLRLRVKIAAIKSVAVYCGAAMPNDASFVRQVHEFGSFLGEHGIALVYGGSNVGTMKILADAVSARDGKIIGVFSRNISEEILRPGLAETIIVDTLAERKAEMLRRADAVIALPGSFGTWDELFDALALRKVKRGGHKHPVGILNINGYFDPLLTFIERSVELGFTSQRHRQLLKVGKTPEELFRQLAGSTVKSN